MDWKQTEQNHYTCIETLMNLRQKPFNVVCCTRYAGHLIAPSDIHCMRGCKPIFFGELAIELGCSADYL
jgi:hypothetical protein